MTIEQMRERKQELGYTYEQIADLSGVPLGTVQKVFGGVTASPRYDTLRALEQVFQKKEPMYVKESALPYEAEARREKRQGEYTVEDYRALPEEQRMELIDGVLYDMAAPTGIHQLIGGEIYAVLRDYIRTQKGKCLPMYAPIDVQLDCDEKTIVQRSLRREQIIRKYNFGGAGFYRGDPFSIHAEKGYVYKAGEVYDSRSA